MEIEINYQFVEDVLEDYQKDTANENVVNVIREVRKQIADFWIATPAEMLPNNYLGYPGKVYQKLLYSNIKNELLNDSDRIFLEEIKEYIARGFSAPNAIQYLLAGMLYCRGDRLPLQYQGAPIPIWFFQDFLKFLLDFPLHFQEIGEVENYYQYLQELVNYIHQKIFSQTISPIWYQIARFFTDNIQFAPLQFTTANLKDIYIKRAEIQEFVLKQLGYQIDYTFPQITRNTNKIRLGILKSDYDPHPETFITFPIFEYLDRDKFEIILYVIYETGHPLEKYAASKADKLIKLPSELPDRVATIRHDNLDILFISTLVTNATNNISLLALHRLAPIQITSIASPVTTGMKNIDYYISGKLTEIIDKSSQHYRENLITIDGTGFCFSYTMEKDNISIETNKQIWGIPETSLIFISAANFYKIIPEVRETWAKILASLPNSVLVLMPFGPSWGQQQQGITFQKSMQVVLSRYNIDNQRLFILPSFPNRKKVKAVLKLGDIYLNTYPYSGSTSVIDALEVGLPTVVMDGEFLRSRMAAALLREIEIPELIAHSEDDYIKISRFLGKNPILRQEIRDRLQEKMQNNPRFLDSYYYSQQMGKLFASLVSN